MAIPKIGRKFDLSEEEDRIYQEVKAWAGQNGITIKGITVTLWKMLLEGKIKL